MATEKPGGGWELTDADVDAIAAAAGFEVERDDTAEKITATEWAHTHRDGTHHRHPKGTECNLHLPEKLRTKPFDELPKGWVAAPHPGHSDGWAHVHADDGQQWVHLWGSECDKANGPGVIRVRRVVPTTDTGEVNFADLLTTDAQWSLKAGFDKVLGRPYLATQLAALLPADVAYRLLARLEHLVAEAVRLELDKMQADVQRVTAETLARMADAADQKLKELNRERFKPTRLG